MSSTTTAPSSDVRSTDSNNDRDASATSATSAPPEDTSYPEQKHAGKVGYGPNYHKGPTFDDKLTGVIEEVKGKVKKNPDLVNHGKEVYSGDAKRKELSGGGEKNPFEKADDKPGSKGQEEQPKANPAGLAHSDEKGAKDQAATVSPEGTEAAQRQKEGHMTSNMKNIDES